MDANALLGVREAKIIHDETTLIEHERVALEQANAALQKAMSVDKLVVSRLRAINASLVHVRRVRNSGAAGSVIQGITNALSQIVAEAESGTDPLITSLEADLNKTKTFVQTITTEKTASDRETTILRPKTAPFEKAKFAAVHAANSKITALINSGNRLVKDIESTINIIKKLNLPMRINHIKEIIRQLNTVPEPNYTRLNSAILDVINGEQQEINKLQRLISDIQKIEEESHAVLNELHIAMAA